MRKQLKNKPSSPESFTIHKCDCGKDCSWCVDAEDLRVRNPFPNAKPAGRPKQCTKVPHQCTGCFEKMAIDLYQKGDPSVMIHNCSEDDFDFP